MTGAELKFKVLHLSDLHERVALYGMPEDRLTKIRLGRAKRHRVLGPAFDEVLGDVLHAGPIDAVCFTGDVADWGLPEEYEAATPRIAHLLTRVSVPPDRFFAVPGNHDVRRTIATEAWRAVREVALEDAIAVSDWMGGRGAPRGVSSEHRETVLERESAFWAWLRAVRGDDLLTPRNNVHRRLGYRHTLHIPTLSFPIHLVGLDSAWLAGGDDDTGKLFLLDSQMNLLCYSDDGQPLDGFRIALVHHPSCTLYDERPAHNVLADTTDLLLHGHQHDPIAGGLTTPDRSLYRLAAGSLYEGDREDRWLNAFQRVDVILAEDGCPLRYEVTFYAWSERGHWHRSGAIYKAAPDGRLIVDLPATHRHAPPIASKQATIVETIPSVHVTTAAAPTISVVHTPRDAGHWEALRQAGRRLEERGLGLRWVDLEVKPGVRWDEPIQRQLEESRLVLPLVSPDLLAAPGCVDEFARLLHLREQRLLDVVPVVVRQCAWRETSLGAVRAFPAGGAPVESWPDALLAWRDIVDDLRPLLHGERAQPAFPSRAELVRRCAEVLEAERRLMLLAPWRAGQEELAQEIARATHGEAVTTLRLPALEKMSPKDFYAELSGEPLVTSATTFRQWLVRRSAQAGRNARHLVVLPYFGGPRDLVRQLGHTMRAVFDEFGTFSLLVLGMARCAELLAQVQHFSLFSGIMTEHAPGMDLAETGTLLERFGADRTQAARVRAATGGHPEWTALAASEARRGRLEGLSGGLAERKLLAVLRDRLRLEHGRRNSTHAASTLEKLLAGKSVVRLTDARDDLGLPEVRLYFDGVVEERDERTAFRCEAAQLAAARVLEIWRQKA